MPSVTVTYSASPELSIDTSSLVVTVNGTNLSARFQPAGSTSASASLALADRIAAGTQALHIVASVRDTNGMLAEAAQTYDVLPVLGAISPARGFSIDSTSGAAAESIAVGGEGLDPVAGRNQLRFDGVFGPVDAPFDSVDIDNATGTIRVPEGAVTGPVSLVVNGAVSQNTFPFEVLSPISSCGYTLRVLPRSDGGYYALVTSFAPTLGVQTTW